MKNSRGYIERQYLLPYLTGVKKNIFFYESLFYIERWWMMLSVGLSYVWKHMGGGQEGVPRKFNEMVESISTTLIDNDIGEYFRN